MRRADFVLVVLAALAWSARAGATTYTVATTGDDANAGTDPSKPLKTIQHAIDLAVAGDVIDVRAGTYAESAHFQQSGAAGAPITLRAHAGERPVISPGASGFGVLFEAEPWRDRIEIGWLAVDGFEITGADVGVELTNGHDLSITHCDIHDSVSQGILGEGHDVFIAKNDVHHNGDPSTNLDHGMYLTGHRFTIVDNLIHDNASYGIQVAAYGCYATSGQCAGPEYSGAVDWLIAYNTIAFEQNRSAIVLWLPDSSYGTPLGTLSNVTIVDNVFYDNVTAKNGAPNGVSFVSYDADATIAIRHNLFFSADGAPDMDSPGAAVTSGAVHGDPLFVDPSKPDFHLKKGSPAIDVGEGVSGVDDDFDGVHRPQGAGFDLGAFELPVAAPDAGTDALLDAPKIDVGGDAPKTDAPGADGEADATPDASSGATNDESSGCSCDVPGARPASANAAWLVALLALSLRRRLTSRSSSPRPTTPPDPRGRVDRSRGSRSLRARC